MKEETKFGLKALDYGQDTKTIVGGAKLGNDSDSSDEEDKNKSLSFRGKKEHVLSDIELAMMVKHSDPLKYYTIMTKKKMKDADVAFNKLIGITNRDGHFNQTVFRNKMFQFL